MLDIIIVSNHYKVEPVCKVEQSCPIIRCRQTVELKKRWFTRCVPQNKWQMRELRAYENINNEKECNLIQAKGNLWK